METRAYQAPSPDWEKFTQRDADGAMFTPSLQIVLYANQPLPELAFGAIACYEMFINQFGSDLKLYHARSMRKPRVFTEKYVDVFPTLCRETGIALPAYRVYNGTGLQDYVPPIFATDAYAAFSYLQMHLPPELARDWTQLWKTIIRAASSFPFRYGTVGYSLCWNEISVDRDIEVPRLIAPLLKRYPGFNIGTPGELCDQDIPPVNWITLLGPDLLSQLGGTERVQSAFPDEPNIVIATLGNSVIIRAGEVPQLGDRNRRDNIPLYHQVGSYLGAFRGHQEIELDGLTQEESEEWLGRFDK